MRDLLIVTPTRQRPDSARRLAAAVRDTATAGTVLMLAVDDDDPSYGDGVEGAEIIRGPRRSCVQWSNLIAAEHGPGYRAVASLGDDHVPETPGWDTALLAAIDAMGGTGIAYGDDALQGQNLPTAPVVSSDIVAALGWLFLPQMRHFFCDNAWKDIAQGAGCLAWLPGVVVRHLHCCNGTAPHDAVYASEEPAMEPDRATYEAWRDHPDGMAADVAKVRALMAAR